MPTSLIVYVLVVLACDLALIGWELAATPPRPGDLLLFCALLAAADVALYRAKDAGRDQVRIYAHATGNATENKDEATDACP